MKKNRIIASALLLGGLVAFSPAMAQTRTVKMTTAKAVGAPMTLMVNHTYKGVTVDWGDGNPVAYNTGNDALRVIEGTVKGSVITIEGDITWDMLNCANCELTALDLSGATTMHSLYCQNNNLTTLDLRGLSELTDLDCSNNQISAFVLTKDGYIEEDLKKVECVNVSSNKLSGTFAVRSATLQSLDASNNNIEKLYVTSNPNLKQLKCGQNALTSLGLSANKGLTTLVCDNNALATLTLPATGVPELVQVVCDNNELTRLNFSVSEKLTDISCKGNKIATLTRPDVQLNVLDISGNKLTLKDLPRTTKKPTYVQFSPQAPIDMTEMTGVTVKDGAPTVKRCPSYSDRNKADYVLDMSEFRYIGVTSSSAGQLNQVTFQWYSVDGETETPMTLAKSNVAGDYSNSSGKFAFFNDQRKMYLRMTCDAYGVSVVTNPVVVGDDVTGVNRVVSDKDFTIAVSAGAVTMSSAAPLAVRIYTVDGKAVWNGQVGAESVTVNLPKGVYVVNGKKVVL